MSLESLTGFAHPGPASLVLGGLVTAVVLWLMWPLLSGWFPRLTAFLWPHLLVGGLLLVPLALLFAGIAHGASWLWSRHDEHWAKLAGDSRLMATLDWLWPWFPTLFGLFLLLFLTALALSRRLFHAVALLAVSSVILGVVFHEDLTSTPSQDTAALQARFLSSGLLQLQLPDCYTPRCLEAAATERWTRQTPSRPEPPRYSVPEVASERLSNRILNPTFHREDTRLDALSAAVLGVLLLLGFSWVDRFNLRRTLQPIRVARIEEDRDLEGNPRMRPDLENLMRECIHRHTPHTPPPLPGGSLEYWQDFVEEQSTKDNHWLSRAVAFVMRLVRPPSGLEITGTLLPADSAPRGIRINMVDLRTGRTLMARTFSGRSIERAVEHAAYSAVERALEQCRVLPEWSYWEEGDGSALWMYHQGVEKLRAYASSPKMAGKARSLLEQAARKSLGSAMVRLQLAEALEACGDYVGAIEIYLQVSERYPNLRISKFRLASACRRSAGTWARRLDEQNGDEPDPAANGSREPSPRERLLLALEGRLARRLRRPTLLGRLIERQVRLQEHVDPDQMNRDLEDPPGSREQEARSAQAPPRRLPRSRPPRVKHRQPIIFRRRDTPRLERALLNMAARALLDLERLGRWSVLSRCFLSTAERRLFWNTLLWPPQKRRDDQLSIRAARGCVEWQQLKDLEQQYQQVLEHFEEARPGSRAPAGERLHWHLARLRWRLSHPPLALQKGWCQYMMRRLAHHSGHATRIRPNWLGGANYHLACFYSLCMGTRLLDLPDKPFPTEQVWQEPPLSDDPAQDKRLKEQKPIRQALGMFRELSTLYKDAGVSATEALLTYTPPPLEPAKGGSKPEEFLPSVSNSRIVAANLENVSTLMDKVSESAKRLPCLGLRARWRADRRRRSIKLQYARRRLGALARADRLREQRDFVSRFWTPMLGGADGHRSRDLLAQLEGGLDALLHKYERLINTSTGSVTREVAELHRRADALHELLARARTFLLTETVGRRAATAALLGMLVLIRVRLDALMKVPIARLSALRTLVARLEAQKADIGSLQELCREVHALQRLGRCACEHLSHAIRDVDGPFTANTQQWLLHYPDLEPLRAQHCFKAWEWVTLRQKGGSEPLSA